MPAIIKYTEHADEWMQKVYRDWIAAVGVAPVKPDFSALVGKAHTYQLMRDLVNYYREHNQPIELAAADAKTALYAFAKAMKTYCEKHKRFRATHGRRVYER
jgi:hypothetical protein